MSVTNTRRIETVQPANRRERRHPESVLSQRDRVKASRAELVARMRDRVRKALWHA